MIPSFDEYEHDHDSYHDDEEHAEDCPHHGHHCCHHHDDEEDDLDDIENDSPTARRHGDGYRASPRSPGSRRYTRYLGKSSSAPDGYEAFENTNNKKKRKIPTSGSMSMQPSSLTADLAHLGLSSQDGTQERIDVSHGISTGTTVTSGNGITGRGRTARKSNSRIPLGSSINGSNLRASGRHSHDASTTTNGEIVFGGHWIFC